MPIITKVSAQKRPGRYNVFLDGQYAFSASEQTIAEFILLKGQELSAEQVSRVKQFDAGAKATNLASNFLSYEPRTVFEVLQYLNKHDVDEQSAQSAVAQLSEMGFLDDRKYVEVAVRQSLRTGTEGPLSLSRKMTQKGVAAELVESELAAIADEDWLDAGLRVLKSMKSKVGKLSERELERKMRSKLMSHGFSGALVEMIIAEVNLQTGTDEQLEALKKQGVKAYKRFRRLSASARQTKMRNYLYAHGFTSSEIDSFMAGEIIPLDELAEY